MVIPYRVGTNRPIQRLSLHVSSVSPLPKSYWDAFNDPNCRYKARLVANSSTQLEGVDVDETFSPAVKPSTIQTVLSLAASRHWSIHQLDVKNAFLHGDLSETIYMHHPPGFRDSVHPDYVHRVETAYLLLYVDDIVLTASSQVLLEQIITSLHQEFSMTDLGYCVFLGNNLLFWSSKRQPMLSHSSAEVEYRGVANVVVETCWLRNLLCELHTPLSSATLVYCDNVSRVLYVPSCNQCADIFIKGLPSALFEEFRTSLSILCPPAPTAEEC
ncbi:ribonuclease H-like domain-containing protein [Tanacetum coccineum]